MAARARRARGQGRLTHHPPPGGRSGSATVPQACRGGLRHRRVVLAPGRVAPQLSRDGHGGETSQVGTDRYMTPVEDGARTDGEQLGQVAARPAQRRAQPEGSLPGPDVEREVPRGASDQQPLCLFDCIAPVTGPRPSLFPCRHRQSSTHPPVHNQRRRHLPRPQQSGTSGRARAAPHPRCGPAPVESGPSCGPPARVPRRRRGDDA